MVVIVIFYISIKFDIATLQKVHYVFWHFFLICEILLSLIIRND